MPTHLPISTHKKQVQVHKHTLTPFDKLVMLASFVYPLSSIPQVINVFTGATEGVSILSWSIFLVCASLFLTYGIRRNVPPMIISNSIWVIMDALVIVGILLGD